jgi:hypothetical protein
VVGLLVTAAAKPASCCLVLPCPPNHFRARQQWRQAFATAAPPLKDRDEVPGAIARRDLHTVLRWSDKFQRMRFQHFLSQDVPRRKLRQLPKVSASPDCCANYDDRT